MLKISYHKIVYILFLILSFGRNSKAQNLVSNGYFENHTNCSNPYINNAIGWFACSESPDYYNACLGGGGSVPYADMGYQKDCCGGVAYAGGFMFDKTNPNNDRDYIYTKLINTLQAGHKYLVSMYVSRGEAVDYAVASIGMLFTDTATTVPYTQGYISANPQVKNTTLLADTMNWMLIQDTITAVGSETYLTIGNFNTAATSDTARLTNYWLGFPIAYYYFDNVSVYDVATLGVNEIKNNDARINVYPNPVSNNFKLVCSLQLASCSLQDVLGNILRTQEFKNKEETIDVSDLPEGIYFVCVKTTEGVVTKKIIVQR